MTGSRNSDPAVGGLMTKIKDLSARKIEADEKVAALNKKAAILQNELASALSEVKQIEAERQKCVALVREVAGMLGVTLPELPPDIAVSQPVSSPAQEQSVSPDAVKDRIEQLVRDAHPGYLKLSDIREQLGGGVADDLVKKMLHRLGRHKVLKSIGWKWHYVPPECREEAYGKYVDGLWRMHETEAAKPPR